MERAVVLYVSAPYGVGVVVPEGSSDLQKLRAWR